MTGDRYRPDSGAGKCPDSHMTQGENDPMNDWQKEQAAKAERLHKLTREVAAQLGTPWKADEEHGNITNDNGATLYLGFDRDRVTVSGGLHIGKNRQYVQPYENGKRLSAPSITVAFARGVETIAKEINRRVLPEYLRIFELAKAQVQQENEITNQRQANIRKLVAITGSQPPNFEQQPDTEQFYLPGKRYGIVRVKYHGGVDFERLDCSLEEAEFILRYLYRQEGK